jgi:DNA-binding CsgD family transcriptional regulator
MFANDREQTQMLAFIGQLYDAAGDPTAWAPMAAKMAAVFGAESCLLQAADLRSGGTQFLGVTDNIPPSFWSAYEAHYYREDQWAQNAFLYPDRALLGEEMGSEDWYRRSEFFNEVCVTAHAHYIIGAGLSLGDERLGLIGIHRPRSGSAFGQDDRRRLEILLPHIARAEARTFRFANAGLDRQASLAKPGPLRAAGGRLTCDNPRTASQLGKLIQSAVEVAAGRGADHPGRGLAIDRGVESLPLTALVAPFRPARSGIGAVRPAALVFIRDPEMPGLSAQLLRDLFQLTPAQAAVAQHLGDGRSLHQVAEALGISLHTARAHLQAVFEKTNTTRQPQLAALLARSIAGLDAPSPRS